MNIYVGNLSYHVTDGELRDLFSDFGDVSRANVIKDRDNGQSKGFGFVEMTDTADAKAAIAALNGVDVKGRDIKVNEARPRNDRPPQRSYNNNRGGGGRY